MAWTQSDQDVLRAAMAKGVKSVTYNSGNTVAYQTLQEMMELDRLMTAEIAATSGTAKSRTAYVQHSRG